MARFIMTSRGLARVLMGVPLAFLVIMLSVVSSRSREKLEDLRRHAVSTTGNIEAGECTDDGEVAYRFTVDAKEYRGTGFCPVNCGAVAASPAVSVLYDARDPDTSICEPLERELGRMQRFFTPLILGGLAGVAAIFWFTRRRTPRIVKARVP
jgi:hypothetical protein